MKVVTPSSLSPKLNPSSPPPEKKKEKKTTSYLFGGRGGGYHSPKSQTSLRFGRGRGREGKGITTPLQTREFLFFFYKKKFCFGIFRSSKGLFEDHGMCTNSLYVERVVYEQRALLQPPPSALQLTNRQRGVQFLLDFTIIYATPLPNQ